MEIAGKVTLVQIAGMENAVYMIRVYMFSEAYSSMMG